MLSDTLYLENIEEYVQDESKIVTYKWLSRSLEVPANTAKRMLYSYVSHCRNKNNSNHQINVTYLVTGISNKQNHQVCIVGEDDLEDTKKKFSELLGIHIYSVQKHKLKETCSLYTADYDISQECVSEYSKWSPIECAMDDVRNTGTREQKSYSHTESTVKPPLPTLSHMEIPNVSKQDVPSPHQVAKQDNPKPKTTTTKTKASKSKPAPKGSVMSFFGSKSVDKKKAPSAEKVVEPKPQKDVSAPSSPTPMTTSPPKEIIPPHKEKATKTKASGLFVGLDDSDIDNEDSEEESPQPKKTKPSSRRGKKNNQTARGTKRVKGTKQDKDSAGQKRRRVQELSSDEEVTEKEKKTETTIIGGRRRKKVRRLVSKRHKTSDGSMETERSWEMVSTDASEEESSAPAVSKTHRVETKTEIEKGSPKKKKQATLRNFFKK